MPERSQPKSRPVQFTTESSWSIASGGLTSTGRSELLRQLGSQMRDEYQQVISEPVPDHLEQLIGKLEKQDSGEASG